MKEVQNLTILNLVHMFQFEINVLIVALPLLQAKLCALLFSQWDNQNNIDPVTAMKFILNINNVDNRVVIKYLSGEAASRWTWTWISLTYIMWITVIVEEGFQF